MHRLFTRLLLFLLLASGAWTAWQWWRPYELRTDAAWQVRQVTISRDHDYAWVDIEIRKRSRERIPSPPLSHLVNANHSKKEPADARISADGNTCQLRYWLEWPELDNAWNLELEDDTLRIKEAGTISLDSGQSRTFHQTHW